jgi:hypothetical protein
MSRSSIKSDLKRRPGQNTKNFGGADMPFDAAPVRSPLPDNTAGQSALVLNMMEFYFRDGQRWAHRTWWEAAGEKRCLLGAVRFVRSEILSDRDQAEYYLARAIHPAQANGSPTRVMQFNDAKGRTYPEIAAVLRKAKEMAEIDARASAAK